MYIRISVKGNREVAGEELNRRGIHAKFIGSSKVINGQSQSFWEVTESYRPQLVAWHCEPASCREETGFPEGTLLYHG